MLKGNSTFSTSCTGIDTPIIAAEIAAAAIARRRKAPLGSTSITNLWGCEISKQCRAELLAAENGPCCLFADQTNFLSDDTKKRLSAISHDNVEETRALI